MTTPMSTSTSRFTEQMLRDEATSARQAATYRHMEAECRGVAFTIAWEPWTVDVAEWGARLHVSGRCDHGHTIDWTVRL